MTIGRCGIAAYDRHTETVRILAQHIFVPNSWGGKSRAEIEAHAKRSLYQAQSDNPQPERLRTAGTILIDSAMTCWEQVRPAPPKIQISPHPANPGRVMHRS